MPQSQDSFRMMSTKRGESMKIKQKKKFFPFLLLLILTTVTLFACDTVSVFLQLTEYNHADEIRYQEVKGEVTQKPTQNFEIELVCVELATGKEVPFLKGHVNGETGYHLLTACDFDALPDHRMFEIHLRNLDGELWTSSRYLSDCSDEDVLYQKLLQVLKKIEQSEDINASLFESEWVAYDKYDPGIRIVEVQSIVKEYELLTMESYSMPCEVQTPEILKPIPEKIDIQSISMVIEVVNLFEITEMKFENKFFKYNKSGYENEIIK